MENPSRPVIYGGDGMLERSEYDELRQDILRSVSFEAVETIEDIFQVGQALHTVESSMSAEGTMSSRELVVSYDAIDNVNEAADTLVCNVDTGEISLRENPMSVIQKNVVIRHHVYRNGPKKEEYLFAIDRSIPFSKGFFTAIYEFEFFAGGGVHLTVGTNNIDVDDGVDGSVFSRSATQYDIGEFYKEIAEVHAHLNAGAIERDRPSTLQ